MRMHTHAYARTHARTCARTHTYVTAAYAHVRVSGGGVREGGREGAREKKRERLVEGKGEVD